MEYKDYYKILGVDRTASDSEIKKAYRKLAGKYHPDKPSGDETKFKEISEAYEVLGDAEKRRMFDQLGPNYQNGQNFTPPPGFEEMFGGGFGGAEGFGGQGSADFSDFFESLFGFGGQTQSGFSGGFQQKGEDQSVKVLISVEEAAQGAEKSLSLQVPTAGLQGQVTQKRKQLNVKIPAGVKQGSRIRLKGKGAPGFGGGPNGDLYLEVDLQRHPLYQVDGKDVHLDLPLTPWEAALGTKVSVPTLHGNVHLNIPAGAQSGKKMRLKHRGLGKGDSAGHQYVIVQIHTPPADSQTAKDFYQQMADTLPYNPRAHF